jgi:hypothetical protein
MPRWPVNLLLKLFAEPGAAIGGAAATAEAFLPSRSDAPSIRIGRTVRAHARTAARRWARRPTSRRRLVS